ncbi:MAG: HNH endonuclease signature motif containing protein [Bacilli bacterium]|jgi:hypothetical protein
MPAELSNERRLIVHIARLFDDFLKCHRLRLGRDHDVDMNNEIVELRNLVSKSIKSLFAEPSVSRKLGAPIDSLSLISFAHCKSCPPRETVSPPVPHDLGEAQKLESLLPRISEFREKFRVLKEELHPIAQQMSQIHGGWSAPEIESLIYRIFFRELEDRPHQPASMGHLWASVKTDGVIRNRNLPCEVCGENRRTEKCHIIPSALGGTTMDGNILVLCPVHHALLDSHMLSKVEWACIDWARKCEVSQLWAKKVLLVGHESFWEQKAPTRPRTALDFGNHQSFAAELAGQLVEIIGSSGGLLQTDAYRRFDPNVRVYLRRVLKTLVEADIVKRKSVGRTHMLFLDKHPEVLTDVISGLRFRF